MKIDESEFKRLKNGILKFRISSLRHYNPKKFIYSIKMKYRKFLKGNIDISSLGFGTMRFPTIKNER